MSQKIFNVLHITGFPDEETRSDFEAAAAKGTVPFSLERLLPLSEAEEIEREYNRLYRELYPERSTGDTGLERSGIDLAAKWGSLIYEKEGHSLSENNKVELFDVGGELGIEYCFESHNDPPFNAIRHLSRRYPELLFKLYFDDDVPDFGFALYKRGRRFFVVFEEEEFEITRAAEWPMVAALHPQNRDDEQLHRFLCDAAESLPEDVNFEEEIKEAGEEERRTVEKNVEMVRDQLRRRGK